MSEQQQQTTEITTNTLTNTTNNFTTTTRTTRRTAKTTAATTTKTTNATEEKTKPLPPPPPPPLPPTEIKPTHLSTSNSSVSHIIQEHLLELLSQRPDLKEKWIDDDQLFDLLCKHFSSFKDLDIGKKTMNSSIFQRNVEDIERVKFPNTNGIFRTQTYRATVINGKNICLKKHMYYFVKDKNSVPPAGSIPKNLNDYMKIYPNYDILADIAQRKRKAQEPKKSKKKQTKITSPVLLFNHPIIPPHILKAREMFNNYWDSSEAKQLFAPNIKKDESVMTILKERVAFLQKANRETDGWRKVLQDTNDKILAMYSIHQINAIKDKSITLCLAYQFAIEKMNLVSWKECCNQAVTVLNKAGIGANRASTVMEFNRQFRTSGRFPLSNANTKSKKKQQREQQEIEATAAAVNDDNDADDPTTHDRDLYVWG